MPSDWSRRGLLTTMGATALAGCTGVPPSTNDDPSPTPNSVDTEWPMPAHDAGRSNADPDAAGPTEQVEQLWQVEADAALSRPVLADGTLYVGGGDGTVLALDAATGEERWRRHLVYDDAGTPWVLGDHVYVPTPDFISVLDASDGAEQWRTGIQQPVIVTDHGIYWFSDGGITALDRADGDRRWTKALREPWEDVLFAGDDAVFVSSGTHGRRPWVLEPDTGDVIGGAPQYGHDFAAERFHRDGRVYAFDPLFGNVEASAVDGGEGWSRGVNAVGAGEYGYAMSGGAERVYLLAGGGDQPGLYALSDADGSVDWHTDIVTEVVSRPVVAGECVLVRAPDALYAFDPGDGAKLWSVPADRFGNRVTVADDLVFTAAGKTVRAFRPG